MPNSDLLPSLLFKINQNQLALEAVLEKIEPGCEIGMEDCVGAHPGRGN